MLLYNPTAVKQSLQALGKWFTFAPGEKKMIHNEEIAHFILTDKRSYGIVGLPDRFAEDAEYAQSEEGQAILEAKRQEGIQNRINYLNMLVHNEEVSLRQDLEKSGQRINPNLLSSNQYVQCLEELKEYKRAKDDGEKEKMARIARLKADLNKE